MKLILRLFAGALVLLFTGIVSLDAAAQGPGQGGAGQGKGRSNAPTDSGPKAAPGNQGGGQNQGPGGQQVRNTKQQRAQLKICNDTCLQVRKQARDMIRASTQPGFGADQAQALRAQLQTRFQTMVREHQRFQQTLTDEQKASLQTQLKEQTLNSGQIQDGLTALDAALSEPTLNQALIQKHCEAIEKAATQYLKQARSIEGKIGGVNQ